MIKCEKGCVEINGSRAEILAELGGMVGAMVQATEDRGSVLQTCIFGLFEKEIMDSSDPVKELSAIHKMIVASGYLSE